MAVVREVGVGAAPIVELRGSIIVTGTRIRTSKDQAGDEIATAIVESCIRVIVAREFDGATTTRQVLARSILKISTVVVVARFFICAAKLGASRINAIHITVGLRAVIARIGVVASRNRVSATNPTTVKDVAFAVTFTFGNVGAPAFVNLSRSSANPAGIQVRA